MTAIRRGPPALVLSCLLCLFLPVAAPAAPTPSHALLFALEGAVVNHVPTPPPEAELEDACGVAVDPAGDLYVSDYYHHTIDVYGPNLEYLTQIADADPDGPCDLAVDAAGDVYVDNWRRDVVRYAPSEFPPTETTRYGPGTTIDRPSAAGARSTGVALDPQSGSLYVDDRTYVAVYEPIALAASEPEPSRTFGLGVLGAGYGIAVSAFPATEGDVYVPDAGSGSVRTFGPSGTPVGEVGGAGTPQGGFVSLVDSSAAVDPTDGHLFVADDTQPGFESPAAVVDEFDPSGDYRGQLPHALVDAEPSAIATDASGRVYVTSGDTEGAAVLGFGPTLPAHLLEVAETGAGGGVVTSEPAGIDCGPACAAEFAVGEEVVLTAVAEPGSALEAWVGCDRSVGPRCVVTMGAGRAVTAEFGLAPEALGVGPVPAAPGGTGAAAAALPAPLSIRRQGGTGVSAVVRLSVPADGTISLNGPDLRPISLSSAAGTSRIRLRLDRDGILALERGKAGVLAVDVRVRFTPARGGTPTTIVGRVVFRGDRKRRSG